MSCDQQHYIEAMAKTWLLEGREATSVEEASKAIRPFKLYNDNSLTFDSINTHTHTI